MFRSYRVKNPVREPNSERDPAYLASLQRALERCKKVEAEKVKEKEIWEEKKRKKSASCSANNGLKVQEEERGASDWRSRENEERREIRMQVKNPFKEPNSEKDPAYLASLQKTLERCRKVEAEKVKEKERWEEKERKKSATCSAGNGLKVQEEERGASDWRSQENGERREIRVQEVISRNASSTEEEGRAACWGMSKIEERKQWRFSQPSEDKSMKFFDWRLEEIEAREKEIEEGRKEVEERFKELKIREGEIRKVLEDGAKAIEEGKRIVDARIRELKIQEKKARSWGFSSQAEEKRVRILEWGREVEVQKKEEREAMRREMEAAMQASDQHKGKKSAFPRQTTV